jgi:hypothetical protein
MAHAAAARTRISEYYARATCTPFTRRGRRLAGQVIGRDTSR